MVLLFEAKLNLEHFPPASLGANKNVLRTNAFGECYANVFDDFNYVVGIKSSIFQLRSWNKSEGFPIT